MILKLSPLIWYLMCLTFIQLEKDIYKLRLMGMNILVYLDVLLVRFYTPESLKEDIETTLGFSQVSRLDYQPGEVPP